MDNYSQHIWHPFTHPNDTRSAEPIHIVSGDGVYITDSHGKRYLDGNAGGLWCVNAGHNRREINQAITQQLEQMAFYHIFHGVTHPRACELAERLIGLTRPEGMSKVFFTSGGSDGVENAIKLARQYHGLKGESSRKKIIALKGSYHGTHLGAAAVSGNLALQRAYGPVMPGGLHVDMPCLYRNPWGCSDPDELVEQCIQQLINEIEFRDRVKYGIHDFNSIYHSVLNIDRIKVCEWLKMVLD